MSKRDAWTAMVVAVAIVAAFAGAWIAFGIGIALMVAAAPIFAVGLLLGLTNEWVENVVIEEPVEPMTGKMPDTATVAVERTMPTPRVPPPPDRPNPGMSEKRPRKGKP